ncbi:MAG: DNA-binding protein [Nitrospirales bacterium]|nr:DNA-binding protein [Nitrospirales bacterium]
MRIRLSLALSLFAALCIFLSPPLYAEDLVIGKVVETMESGGYSYVLLDTGGKKKVWVAVPQMQITKGKRMAFLSGMEMTNFTSKTLKKKFDRIIFSAGPADSQKKEPLAWENLKVTKPKGANVYTVADLYKKLNELKGKRVVVRGQVEKFSPEIMQKNWIHLQDGSGDKKKGDHDIVVTTKHRAAVGDIVTVSGTLMKDKDYGSGYKYPLVIEDAALSQ